MTISLYLNIFLILLLECLSEPSIQINDICKMSPKERLSKKYIFNASIPMAGLISGKYYEFNNVSKDTCFWKCCNNYMCNVAWFFRMKCLTFECDINDFDKCMPKPTFGHQAQAATLLLLRSPEVVNQSHNEKKGKTTGGLTTTFPTATKKLLIEVSRNQTLTMPTNNVTLTANVQGDKNSKFEYQWSLLSKPSDINTGKMDTTNTKELKLSDLVVGEYKFQVEVRGPNSYGRGIVFVIVNPAKKRNAPPVAEIVPNNQTVQLPNNVILDGSKSTDDAKIDSYYWELVKGPLAVNIKMKNDESMLNLQNLLPGSYIFKLTVKDATGLSSSDTAYLTVLPENDYPPQADPGPNIIVELPVKYVILNGSGSRDDKKIMFYQWTKKSDGLTADIQGSKDPILNLTNLQEGTYTFNLKVTDALNQSSDKDVQMFVKARINSRPVARASVTEEKTVTVRLPATEAILNGSLSSDDDKITEYRWTQVKGNPKLNLVDDHKPIASVYDLKRGQFLFNLTVFDKEGLSGTDTVLLRITESSNQRPQAKIEKFSDFYHLDSKLVKIDGSKSSDDDNIVQYKWTREDNNPAICQVLEASDSFPILILTDLVTGIYKFNLKVVDKEGLFDNVLATLTILPPKNEKNLVELQFNCIVSLFSELKKNAFLSSIQLLIQKKLNIDVSKVVIHVVRLEKVHFKNSITIVFYVSLLQESLISTTKVVDNQNTQNKSLTDKTAVTQTSKMQEVVVERLIDALEVVDALNVLRRNALSMEYQITRIDTYVCQNNCSNHGKCNDVTKLCECQTFWMSSVIRDSFGDGRPNCDWSVIYLIILLFIGVFSLSVTIWICCRFRNRTCKSKKVSKGRKHKYSKLTDHDYEERQNSNSKLPKSLSNGLKSRMSSEKYADSQFNTDSTSSSNEDVTLFKKPQRKIHHPLKRSSSISLVPPSDGNMLKTL